MLTHSSGLPREAGDHWTTFEFPTIDQVRALIGDRQAAFPPETRWKYSNLAYAVAGYVVEAITGESWSDYIQRNVFDPLGMTASSVDQNVAGLATGYGPRLPDGSRVTTPFVDSRGMPAATGITSTVDDMARFVSAQFRRGSRGGDRILSTASLREMHRVRMLETNWTSGTGVGFAVNRIGDKVYVGHGGGYPGYTTQTLIQLDSKVGVVVLTNTNDSNPSDIARQLMRTVGRRLPRPRRLRPVSLPGTPHGHGSWVCIRIAAACPRSSSSTIASSSSIRTGRTSTILPSSNPSATISSASWPRPAAGLLARWCVSSRRVAASSG